MYKRIFFFISKTLYWVVRKSCHPNIYFLFQMADTRGLWWQDFRTTLCNAPNKSFPTWNEKLMSLKKSSEYFIHRTTCTNLLSELIKNNIFAFQRNESVYKYWLLWRRKLCSYLSLWSDFIRNKTKTGWQLA